MRRGCHQNVRLYIFAMVLIYSGVTTAMQWSECLDRVRQEVSKNPDYIFDNPALFRNNSTGEDPVLSPEGCVALCGGAGRHWYKDWGSIINTWILPTLVLLTQKAVMSGHGWWDVIHILANPIRWFKGVLDMIEVSRSCVHLAKNELKGCAQEADNRRQLRRPVVWWKPLSWWDRFLIWMRWTHIETPLFRDRMVLATYLQALKTAADTDMKDMDINDAIALHEKITQGLNGDQRRDAQYEIANTIALTRTGHSRLLLALIALALYGWQAISAFVVTIGGDWTTVPGGRIALAMFWHFLFAAILLSNTVGSFPSHDFCVRAVEKAFRRQHVDRPRETRVVKLMERIREDWDEQQGDAEQSGNEGRDRELRPMIHQNRNDSVTDAITISTQTPPPPKRTILGWIVSRRPLVVFFAIIPVLSSSMDSLALLYYLPPGGPNCRFFLLIAISGTFIINAVLVPMMRIVNAVLAPMMGLCRPKQRQPQVIRHPKWLAWILAHRPSRQQVDRCKDLALAASTTILIILSASGLFNTCGCWSGQWNSNPSEAGLHLNSNKSFAHLLKKKFPILFGVCVGVQFLWFEIIRWFAREGVAALRWSSVVDEQDREVVVTRAQTTDT